MNILLLLPALSQMAAFAPRRARWSTRVSSLNATVRIMRTLANNKKDRQMFLLQERRFKIATEVQYVWSALDGVQTGDARPLTKEDLANAARTLNWCEKECEALANLPASSEFDYWLERTQNRVTRVRAALIREMR